MYLLLSLIPSLSIFLSPDSLGSLVVQSDRVVKSSEKYESIIVLKGKLDFHGETEILVLLGGSAVLHPDSKITKNLVMIRGRVEQMEGAEVASIKDRGEFVLYDLWAWADSTVRKFKGYIRNSFDWQLPEISNFGNFILIGLFVFISFFTILIFLSIPDLGERSTQFLRASPGWCFLLGLSFLLSAIPVLLCSIISIVGIIFIPFIVLAYIGFFFLGYFSFARCLGEFALSMFGIRSNFLFLMIGIISLFLLGMIPWVGDWISSLACIMGAGAIIRGTFGGSIYIRRSY